MDFSPKEGVLLILVEPPEGEEKEVKAFSMGGRVGEILSLEGLGEVVEVWN